MNQFFMIGVRNEFRSSYSMPSLQHDISSFPEVIIRRFLPALEIITFECSEESLVKLQDKIGDVCHIERM